MAFTDELREVAEPIWAATMDHPMVRGIGDGTLSEEPFRQWVCQDYVYLVEYGRVFALGAAHAPDLDRMGRFATLLHETLDTEMDLHRSYAAEFGISEADLEATEPTPTTRAYTDFLVRSGYEGFGETVAALLPCMWGFNETGRRLAADGLPDHEGYAEWIRTYSDEEFTELAAWCRELMDDVAADASPEAREEYRELFLTSSRYEYLFWDAAYRREEWPL
ncbi:thiaminase II [Halomarina ordinaria]|uniref:Thiaminase II n=1 Tax=Halomarina ordinaria TaxID=3033939 RepID=A0ABD5UAQ4_9EURY|nr:thiaminase II [Halomarina sp. PSRA2]